MTRPVTGSTRTVSGPRATQTDPAPNAMPDQLPGRVAAHRDREPLPDAPGLGVETHEPRAGVLGDPRRAAPGRDGAGGNGSLVDDSTSCVARSTRATRRSSPSSTHAWRASNATSQGWLANGICATTFLDVGIDEADRLRRDDEPWRRRITPAGAARRRPRRLRRRGRPRRPRRAHERRRDRRCARQLAAQRRLARSGERAPARIAVARRLRERLRDDRVEAGGNARPHVARPRRRLVHVRVDGGDLGLALERRLPREALEEHAPERVDVGPAVDRAALDLLGRDVRDGADERPLTRQAADRGEVLRQAEVAQVGVVAGIRRPHEHVAGLHVAVDEPERVRRVERGGDLADERDRALGAQRALLPEQLAQVEPVDEAHDEVEHAVVLAHRERRDDVRLVERGGDLRLAQESLAEARVPRELGDQHLERDLAGRRAPPRGRPHRSRRARAGARSDTRQRRFRPRGRQALPGGA